MEDDFFDKYRAAWQKDADDVMSRVAPGMEELLANVEQYERRRRRRRAYWVSGIAAMLVLGVTAVLFVLPGTQEPASPVAAALSDDGQPAPALPSADGQSLPTTTPADPGLLAFVSPARQPLAAPGSEPPSLPPSPAAETALEVAYLDDYPLDASHTVPATIVTAHDSASWEWLQTQFVQGGDTMDVALDQFVQRDYLPDGPAPNPALQGILPGSYLMGAIPSQRSIVFIRYEAVPDLLDQQRRTIDYAEQDSQNLRRSRPEERVPKNEEKVPNRHHVRINSPDYYQTIVPGNPVPGRR